MVVPLIRRPLHEWQPARPGIERYTTLVLFRQENRELKEAGPDDFLAYEIWAWHYPRPRVVHIPGS